MRNKTRSQLQYDSFLLENCRNVLTDSYTGGELNYRSDFLTVFLDTIPLPVFYKDISGKYLGCNKAFEKFIGKTRDEIIGKTVLDTWPKEFADKYENMDRELFEAPGKQIYEWKVQLADGSKREVIFHKSTFDDPSGKTAGLIGVIEDVTELTEAISLLEESGKDLRSVFCSSTESIILIDTSGIVLDANEVVAYRLNTNVETLKGKNIYDFLPPEVAANRRKMADKVITEGKPGYFEDEREGYSVLTSIHPIFNDDGKLERMAIFGLDITEIKKAENILKDKEKVYKSVIETASDGYLCISLDGRILEANEAYCKISGYTREELLNMRVSDLKTEEDLGLNTTHVCRVIEKGKDRFQTRHRAKDGRIWDVEMSATYFEKPSRGFFCSIRDITKSKTNKEREGHLIKVLLAIRKVSQLIIREKDPYNLIQKTCTNLTETLGYHNAWIVLVNGDNSIKFSASSGIESRCNAMQEQLESGKIPFCMTSALKNEKIIVIDHPSTDCADCSLSGGYEGMSGMAGRLQFEGKVYGVLVVLLPSDFAHDKEEQEYFTEIANDLGFALQKISTENALLESEQNYRTLADTGQALIWKSGEDKLCNYFNLSWLRFTGRSFEQELGNGWTEGVHPADMEKCLKIYTEAFDRRERFSMEYRLRRHDGEYRWILDDGSPRYDSKGKFIGYIGHCLDVTELKLTEEALRESESRFRSYMEQAPDGIFISDEKGNYIEANEAASKITGYSKQELLNKNMIEIVSPEDHEKALLHFKTAMKTGSATADAHLLTKDKNKRICTVKAVKLSETRCLGFTNDITERKLVEDEREITIHLLNVLNSSGTIPELIDSVTKLLKSWSGCEAVGIRLKEGDDYPYYQTQGFPEHFIILENSLCSVDVNGQIIRDELGNPLLECMCGNIISGRFDPKMPFFTQHGSFWTNSTSKLLASTDEHDRQARTRNRCNGEGYESVALIPLRTHGETFGLIQLNDFREGLFTLEKIALFERLGDSIALELAQRQAQKAVKENEEKLESIFKAAPIGIGVVNNRVLTSVNLSISEMTGYSYDELIGSSALMLYPTVEDFEYVGKEKYRQITEKGTGTVETRWKRKDGSVIDVLLSSTPIDVSDLSKGVTFTALDITERRKAEKAVKKSEERLSLAIDASDYGFWDLNLDTKQMYCSSQIYNMLGLKDDNLFNNVFFNPDILYPEDKKAVLSEMGKALKEVIPLNLDCRFIHKSGECVWASIKGKPFDVDETGIAHRFVGTMVNITHRVKAEEALLYAKIAANESNRIKSDILKNITHELRTPLTAVIGFSDVMLEQQDNSNLNDSQKRYIQHINNGGRHLLETINKILDFSRYESSEMGQLSLGKASVKQLINETVGLLLSQSIKKNQIIGINIGYNIEEIYVDEYKLKQIIYNLVENAIKFTGEKGSININVSLMNNMLQFSVSDNGIGIEKEGLDRIFDPFIQIDGSISRKYSGTGMGLALVKRFVELHGGSLRVESELGKGSNFIFEIPLNLEIEKNSDIS